jgi:hypothetical protein
VTDHHELIAPRRTASLAALAKKTCEGEADGDTDDERNCDDAGDRPNRHAE